VLLNLTVASARDALAKLAAACDIVVENFAVGVIDRLGIGEPAFRFPG
jgi:crotonobetainyl-CoA:carnitine CoA-transferase CaiB-like acyl-CoA transferase